MNGGAFIDTLMVASDPSGGAYLAGTFQGRLTFGDLPPLEHTEGEPEPGAFSGRGGTDGFVAKFNVHGTAIWARTLGGVGDDDAVVVGADTSGVHVAGNRVKAARKGRGVYIGKYDRRGQGAWTGKPKGWEAVYARDAAVDPRGNVYMLGMNVPGASSEAELDCEFDDADRPCVGDIQVAIIDAAGKRRWSAGSTGDAQAIAGAIGVDAQGHVRVAGTFSGTLSFGGQSLSSTSDGDLFMVEYDSDGAVVRVRHAARGQMRVVGAAVDPVGNSHVAGVIFGDTSFGERDPVELGLPLPPGFSSSPYSEGLFVARYGPTGDLVWVRPADDPDEERGWLDLGGIAADAAGNSYIMGTGYRWQTTEQGDTLTMEAVDKGGIFVAKYSASGQIEWVEHAGAPYERMGPVGDIAVDARGNIVVTGFAPRDSTFGGLKLAGEGDLFVWQRCDKS